MGSTVHSGSTDRTLEVRLEPFLLRVGTLAPQVSVGGFLGVEALVLNVADGARVELEFWNGNGGTEGKTSGEIRSGIFRTRWQVASSNSTGLLVPVVRLPDYGLELAGPAAKLLPPVKIENLRFQDETGKDLDTVVRGDRIYLVADVRLGPMEESIAIDLRVTPDPQESSPGDGRHAHGSESKPSSHPYVGHIHGKRIREPFRADWEMPTTKGWLEYDIGLYGTTSEVSKRVRYLCGKDLSQ